jgi:hypothetical protein
MLLMPKLGSRIAVDDCSKKNEEGGNEPEAKHTHVNRRAPLGATGAVFHDHSISIGAAEVVPPPAREVGQRNRAFALQRRTS